MENKGKLQLINIEIIERLMREKNISRAQMSKKMRVSQRLVNSLLNGADQRKMRTGLIYRLADALEVPFFTFLNPEEAMFSKA